jgi:SH3 domain.
VFPSNVSHLTTIAQADHTSVVRAMYDYEANAPGELSVKEDELLLVFDTEEDWLLVQSQKDGGKAGFVPGNYVEVLLSRSLYCCPADVSDRQPARKNQPNQPLPPKSSFRLRYTL